MEKDAARRGHDLLLQRIAQGLKDEDRDNAEMWRDRGGEDRLQAMFEVSDFMRKVARSRPDPVIWDDLEFPGLPRTA